MSLTGGARPRPSSVSTERHNWRGVDFSASILSLQSRSRLLRSSSRYSLRFEFQTAMLSGVPVERANRSNRRTSRFDWRHSWSNQGSDGRRRVVTVFAGMDLSSIDVISLLYRSASWLSIQSVQLSGWHNRDANRGSRSDGHQACATVGGRL